MGSTNQQDAPVQEPQTVTQSGVPPEDTRKRAAETGYRRLIASARAAKAVYPSFDLRRELCVPRFAALLRGGADAKTAYEAVHHAELLRAAMAYGARRTAEKLAAARITARPAENGAAAQSAAVTSRDPRSLTREQREEIRRRVIERGETVRF